MKAVARRRPLAGSEERHSTVSDVLGRPGCAACRRGPWSAERWLDGFVYEHHTHPNVLASLAASHGFCPLHSRQLLAREGGYRVIPSSYHFVLAAAVEALDEARFQPPATCPVCESVSLTEGSLVDSIVEALNDEAVAQTFRESGGLCYTHAVASLNASRPRVARIIVETLDAQLDASSIAGEALVWIAGADADAPNRDQWRRTLRGEERPASAGLRTVREELHALLRVEATAESRTTALLTAALEDAATAALYETSHGVCLRHAARVPPGPHAGIIRRVLRARLHMLNWELEEAGRKAGWAARYELKGDEMTAWLRAPAALDGRAFLSAPPGNGAHWMDPRPGATARGGEAAALHTATGPPRLRAER